jgi:hypothetical protein
VAKICRIFQVSPSGYYRWLFHPESSTKRENKAIYNVLKASYDFNKGRTGVPYDNACAETFFSTIKMEMIYQEHFK